MRPLRQYLPDRAYLITARCFEERFFLAPDSAALSLIVATSLAQAADKYGLELFAYVVMSNHVHLVVRAPRGGLPEAMQLFFSQVARRVNQLRNRRGPVFSDRYHHQTICDDAALRSAVRYVLSNPSRAGLSESPGSWVGLSSFDDTCNDGALLCIRRTHGLRTTWSMRRVHRKELADLPARTDGDTVETRFVLACRPAFLDDPIGGELAHQELVTSLQEQEERERATHANNKAALRPLGAHDDRPHTPKRSRAPSCIAGNSANRKGYIRERRAFVAAYRLASSKFRRGEAATFPPGCCLPWPRLFSLLGCSDTFPTPTNHFLGTY